MLLILSVVLGLIHCMVYAMPIYLINVDIIWELSAMGNRSETLPLYIAVLSACIVCALCTFIACRKYRKTM